MARRAPMNSSTLEISGDSPLFLMSFPSAMNRSCSNSYGGRWPSSNETARKNSPMSVPSVAGTSRLRSGSGCTFPPPARCGSAGDRHHSDRHQDPWPVDAELADAPRRPDIGEELVEDLDEPVGVFRSQEQSVHHDGVAELGASG